MNGQVGTQSPPAVADSPRALLLAGFEPVPWSGNLPGGGPPERAYDDAVAAWRGCWLGLGELGSNPSALGSDTNTPTHMVSNLRDCRIISASTGHDPVTETYSPVIRQAWVCSPWTAFGPYGFAEASKIGAFWPRMGSKAGAVASSLVLAMAAPDRCRQVRNFLFSTPIHPARQHGAGLVRDLQVAADEARVPVLCRGLASAWRAEEIRDATAGGLLAIPTRVVWLFDGEHPAFLDRHNTQMDLSLARKSTPLRLVDPDAVAPWIWERLASLYAQLYLEKHNRLNPAYTAVFMRAAATSGLIEFLVFPSGDRQGIDAFVGLFSGERQSTCPLVGVETSRQRQDALYRKCCAVCFGLAAARGHRLNFSSGAGQFKRLRGGVQSVEYALVAVPRAARIKRKFWDALRQIVERRVVPMLLREGL